MMMHMTVFGSPGLGERLRDPKMLVKDNPLADMRDDAHDIVHHNMERLERDAKMRRNPATGHVYAGIMSNRLS